MNHYEKLKSTQYWLEGVDQRVKEENKSKRVEFRKAFLQISASFLVMSVVALMMPIWIPALIRMLDWAY